MSVKSELPEIQLISLLKDGDHAAFSEIYSRYWEKMLDYATRLTKSDDEAADIVQEIFVSLWNRREFLEIHSTIIAYLIGATRNQCLKFIDKNVSTNNFLERLSIHIDPLVSEIEENISLKELRYNIDKAIAELPLKMQQVYLLSRDEQLSYREISVRLGITEGTVKKQISNSLKIISERIKPGLYGAAYLISMHLLRH